MRNAYLLIVSWFFCHAVLLATLTAGEGKPPRVLMIGDSISIQGYTQYAAETLGENMVLHHHAGNAETTRNGLKKLEAWLAEEGGQWDVIHFNWGLWDLRQQATEVPVEEYSANLEKLVARLQQTGARLVFATTTPVPANNHFNRRDSDVEAYNAAALKIMRREGIAVNDLYGLVKPVLSDHQLRNDVHFTQKGYAFLAQGVVAALQAAVNTEATISAAEPIKLFNGQDLSGWRTEGDAGEWSAVDGMLRGKSGPKRRGSIIWTKQEFRNFVVELEYRHPPRRLDSGVFLRTEKNQIQLGISGSLNRDMTGSIYIPGQGYPQEAEGVKELLKPAGEWNAMRIEARGNVYTVWLNGGKVFRYESRTAVETGPVGLQVHGGLDMMIEFRNVVLTEIGDR